MKLFKALALACALLIASPAWAALPNFYVDTSGNGGATTDSGTTDNASTSLATCTSSTTWLSTTGCKGTAASWTTSTTTITLDTNTNLQSPFPTDGSQFIYLTNATNSNQKIFSVTGITGCTGTGSCTVTVSVAPTCTTCTAQNWAIGGRVTFPDTSFEGGITSGSTITINSAIACGGAVCMTIRASGDTTNGPITIQGKSQSYEALTNTGNNSILANSTNSNNLVIQGLSLTTVGTAATISAGNGAAVIIRNNKINCNTSTGACITTNGSSAILDNAMTSSGGTGAGVLDSAGTANIIGNYITAVGGDCITDSLAAPAGVIADNILSLCGGWGLNFSGATAAFTGNMLVEGNDLYNNTLGNMTVANKQTSIRQRNNIFYESLAVNNVSYPTVSGITDVSLLAGGSHSYNDYFCGGSCTTNFVNFAASATDITTDPGFTNASGGNFAITSSSGAYATGGNNALLNSSTTSFRSMGVMQLTGAAITINSGIVR